MPKYTLYYHTVASFGVEVEAEDEDEAAEKADKKLDKVGFPSLCAHCTGSFRRRFEDDPPGVELGEWEPLDGKDGIYEHKE